jgi:hypothetical protein
VLATAEPRKVRSEDFDALETISRKWCRQRPYFRPTNEHNEDCIPGTTIKRWYKPNADGSAFWLELRICAGGMEVNAGYKPGSTQEIKWLHERPHKVVGIHSRYLEQEGVDALDREFNILRRRYGHRSQAA